MHEWEEEPHGVPGHVSGTRVVRWFQELLKNLGCRFEAEGDVTRIHLESSLIEVKDEPGRGVIVEASLQLPPSTGEELDFYVNGIRLALGILSSLSPGRSVSYSLDDSIPDYPFLRAIVSYNDLNEAYTDLARALDQLREACAR